MSTIATTQPNNLNDLAQAHYGLVFQKLPNVVYRCQSAPLPGISLGLTEQPSPTHTIPIPGDSIEYEDFVVQFIVDEDLANWIEVYNWIIGLGAPRSTSQYVALRNLDAIRTKFGGLYSDATLISFTNSALANKQIIFKNCFPVSLTEIPYNSSETENATITAQAVFKFVYYEIEDL